MSVQFCPKCQIESITWYRVEQPPRTQWLCSQCGYTAEEDEKQEADCPYCQEKKHFLLIKDSDGSHRWCCNCKRFESSNEK